MTVFFRGPYPRNPLCVCMYLQCVLCISNVDVCSIEFLPTVNLRKTGSEFGESYTHDLGRFKNIGVIA